MPDPIIEPVSPGLFIYQAWSETFGVNLPDQLPNGE
jgi:hypothetical protein